MALKLMDPVYTQMPFFQPNQVLTYNHLNDVAGYLYQQERYTRNKLIGTGIVCGLSFSWTAVAANARVLIDEGCAVTSAGYLIVFKQPVTQAGASVPYTHRRNFNRLKDIEPFKSVPAIGTKTIYELITLDQYNAESEAPKAILADTDKSDRVLILLFDLQTLNVAKCLDESCDDKGKIYDFTPRPLLVPKDVIDTILNANNTKSFFTEPGRSYKGKESVLSGLDYLSLKNLYKNNNLQNVSTPADLVTLFKAPCIDAELTTMSNAINGLISAFPWIFDTQLACMKTEVPALAAQPLGTVFINKSQAFRDDVTNNNYIQYLYDFLRDVVDAYNELFTLVTDLVGECGGNEFMHPFHVMLGLPQSNDTLACYDEAKYRQHNFKYRNSFVPSPVMDGQFMLYENVQSLFKRLVRIIANFAVNKAEVTVKVIPSLDYDEALGSRALPYIYASAATDHLVGVWNYKATSRNKISRIKGYHLPLTQDQLLDADTSKNNFYRIEGHIGQTGATAKTAIDTIRNRYNLPFAVSMVSLQVQTTTVTCTFPELEEEYNYYRDRVLGYIREIERWLESVKSIATSSNSAYKEFYAEVVKAINIMQEDLTVARCIEKFKYKQYKMEYVRIWNAVCELYFYLLTANGAVSSANQAFNSVLNILDIIFFRPIYKIWYMYKYHTAVVTPDKIADLKLLAVKTTGLEHLAGVRRGDTFLLVTDHAQADKVVADFCLPGLPGSDCGCDCNPAACDGSARSLVAPLQKPVIMVVDYKVTTGRTYDKMKAWFDEPKKQYVLELDSMGFYKGDSSIRHHVKMVNSNGATADRVTAAWDKDTLTFRYQITAVDGPQNEGAFKFIYELDGNFDDEMVRGELFLFVIGRTKVGGAGTNYDVMVGEQPKAYYPYDKKEMSKATSEMKFDGPTKKRTIGNKKVDVYTTPNGNELAIYKDSEGLPYVSVVNARNPGVEDVTVVLQAGNVPVKGDVTLNVVDKHQTMESDVIAGKVLNGDGVPLKDVTVTTASGKEVVTNDKGEYSFTGMKAGDVITIEKAGYATTKLQASSNTATSITLENKSAVNVPGLENISVPESISTAFNNINLNNLKTFMK